MHVQACIRRSHCPPAVGTDSSTDIVRGRQHLGLRIGGEHAGGGDPHILHESTARPMAMHSSRAQNSLSIRKMSDKQSILPIFPKAIQGGGREPARSESVSRYLTTETGKLKRLIQPYSYSLQWLQYLGLMQQHKEDG